MTKAESVDTARPGDGRPGVSDVLLDIARTAAPTALQKLGSQPDGLSQTEAERRLKQYGMNTIAREKQQSALMRLLSNVKNPLVLLLAALGVLSLLTGDLRATAVIFVMVAPQFGDTHLFPTWRPARPGVVLAFARSSTT